MDKATNPGSENAMGTTSGVEQHNNRLTDVSVESKATSVTDTNIHADHFSVQSNGRYSDSATVALDLPKTSQQQEITTVQSQSQPQDSASVSATNVGTNPKKGRQRLRKGKWTIEEEEYTSRIIQYFSTGLLTLPDGATLRSYLAEKLNCDPMRITKKFTGACCLGRRAYHLRDRPRASPAEMDMASFELMHLEQRFRLRVEHEQTGLPLPPRHELLASQPPAIASAAIPSLFSLQQGTTVKTTNPWLQNQIIAPSPGQPSLLPGPRGITPNANVPGVSANFNVPHPSLLLAAGQILLQNPAERTLAGNSSSTAPAAAPLQILNNLFASYALSQALTHQQVGVSVLQPPAANTSPRSSGTVGTINSKSGPPSATFNSTVPDIIANVNRASSPIPIEQKSEQMQIYRQPQQHEKINLLSSTAAVSKKEEHAKKLKAAFEEQQRALRLAYEKSLQDAQDWEEQQFASEMKATASDLKGGDSTTPAICTSTNSKISHETASPAEQLQRSYEAHLASLQRAEEKSYKKVSSKSASPISSKSEPAARVEAGGNKIDNSKTKEEGASQKKTSDEEAAVILLGVLNSIRGLRESYEDAVDAKVGSNATTEKNNYGKKNIAVVIPGTRSISTGIIESSKVKTEDSSSSSTRIPENRNRKDHNRPHKTINGRRQSSDTITSLSHFQSSKRKVQPASVTETSSSTSSQPTIEQSSSSQEDSKSDKMGHSSSDDTDESEKKIAVSRRASKGPPRKRLKGFHKPHEFTRENLMAHSKRMDMECGVSADASSSEE